MASAGVAVAARAAGSGSPGGEDADDPVFALVAQRLREQAMQRGEVPRPAPLPLLPPAADPTGMVGAKRGRGRGRARGGRGGSESAPQRRRAVIDDQVLETMDVRFRFPRAWVVYLMFFHFFVADIESSSAHSGRGACRYCTGRPCRVVARSGRQLAVAPRADLAVCRTPAGRNSHCASAASRRQCR
jgi:hypothetical protein